tara:strand:+ start:180 stop:890 length:711 start_codon:yes stop_codon:yes gene_type:complete
MNSIKKKGGSNRSKQKTSKQKTSKQKTSKKNKKGGTSKNKINLNLLQQNYNLPDDIKRTIGQHSAAMTIQKENDKYNIVKIKNLINSKFLTYPLHNYLMEFQDFINFINKQYKNDNEIKQLEGAYFLKVKNKVIKAINLIEFLATIKESSHEIGKQLEKYGYKNLVMLITLMNMYILNTWNELQNYEENYERMVKEDYRTAQLNLIVQPKIEENINRTRLPLSQRENVPTRKIRTI